MRNATEIANDYIALWNERDQTQRMAKLEAGWAADAAYIDPLMHGTGHHGIEALVAGVQAKFPDFQFTLARPADGFGQFVRFTWSLGPKGRTSIIEGTDFVHHENDRITSVTGFLDKVPTQS